MSYFFDRHVARVLLAVLSAMVSAGAIAQAYPTKPVRLISPYPPGGGTDATARIIAQALSDQLGQQVVVDSRGGANGAIGTELAAKAPADGYTLVLGNTATHAILPNLTQKLAYDAIKDFSPISLGALSDFVLAVHPSVPVKSVKELIALARSKPGQLNLAYPVDCQNGDSMLNSRHGPPWFPDDASRVSAGIPR